MHHLSSTHKQLIVFDTIWNNHVIIRCLSQLQLLRNGIINGQPINACAHMSHVLAAMGLSRCTYTHNILLSMCEWVTLASDCAHVCNDYKSAFPWGISLASGVVAPKWVFDGQLVHVSGTIWKSIPLTQWIFAFISSRIPPEIVIFLIKRSGEDTADLIYHEWLQHIWKLASFWIH